MRARRAWMLNKRRPPSWLSSVEQIALQAGQADAHTLRTCLCYTFLVPAGRRDHENSRLGTGQARRVFLSSCSQQLPAAFNAGRYTKWERGGCRGLREWGCTSSRGQPSQGFPAQQDPFFLRYGQVRSVVCIQVRDITKPAAQTCCISPSSLSAPLLCVLQWHHQPQQDGAAQAPTQPQQDGGHVCGGDGWGQAYLQVG
jgi:hypothetical protein